MQIRRSLITVALLTLSLPAIAAEKTKPLNAILIGWDGAQRNHVKEMLAAGKLPTLQALSSEGALVAIDVIRVTDTKAGWTQILTGLEPEITGVYSNGRYAPIPAGLSIFERLEKALGPRNIWTGAVIAKKGHVDNDDEEWIPAEQVKPKRRQKLEQMKKNRGGEFAMKDGKEYLHFPAKPWLNASKNMDLWVNGLEQDEVVGERALKEIDQHARQRFFLFVHFAQIDHKGHKFGENSPEYDAAVVSADTWTGKIIEKLREKGIYGNTMVYVTADHGFDEDQKGHADSPYVFLGTNDRTVMRRGTRADITPTLLTRMGVDLGTLQPPLDGHTLTEPYAPPSW
jgi:hypothetical protein